MVTLKRERFNAEIERMKPYYRRFNSERLVAIVRRGGGIRPYIAAAKAVLKERGIDFKDQ